MNLFPFCTCETPLKDGIVAQPYSTATNGINCLVILYFLLHTHTTYAYILLFSILCFEVFHTFSHTIHVAGTIQTNVIHTLSYGMNLSFLYACAQYTHMWPSGGFGMILLLLVGFDLYSITNLSPVFYLISQALIFISVLSYYYSLLPAYIQHSMYPILGVVAIIVLLFLNESLHIQMNSYVVHLNMRGYPPLCFGYHIHCAQMQSAFPGVPFHVLIELAGIVLFYLICSRFYRL